MGLVQEHHRGQLWGFVLGQAHRLLDRGRGLLDPPGPELGLRQFAEAVRDSDPGRSARREELLADIARLLVVAGDPQGLSQIAAGPRAGRRPRPGRRRRRGDAGPCPARRARGLRGRRES